MSEARGVILRLSGIGRRYDGTDAAALSGIDLAICEGEFVAIVGASGAGKSTLLNILGLLDRPSSGEYIVAGVPAAGLPERERDRLRAEVFGFVFQDAHMLGKETAGGNAALGLRINAVDSRYRPDIVSRALATVGLAHKANEPAAKLSGGERQRVAIARAMAPGPRILLADEPTGALDTENSAHTISMLRELNLGGATVVIITHDPTVAQAADRVVEISDGRIIADRSVSNTAVNGAVNGVANGAATRAAALRNTQSRRSRLSERVLSAISNHTVHSTRALLLLAAFTLGASGLVAASGLSQSAAAQVVDRLDSAALAEFLVSPKPQPEAIRGELGLAPGSSMREVVAAVAPRIRALSGVKRVGVVASTNDDTPVTVLDPLQVKRQPESRPPVFVADAEYLQLSGVRVRGSQDALRMFALSVDPDSVPASDEPASAAPTGDSPRSTLSAQPAVLLGETLAEKLGIPQPTPGSQLWLGTLPVAIAGVIEHTGGEPRFAVAIVANPALDRVLNASDPTFLVRTQPGGPAQLAELVAPAATPGQPTLFQPEIVADLRGLTRGVAADLVTLITIVSWVLLVLSTLSAATAAYLSVHARASEIALRRAIGESRRSVWLQFVLEGLTIGVLGGVLGSALGVILLVVIAGVQGWDPIFDPWVLGLGLLSGSATGVLASLYPAAVAARQEPALAVRGA